MKITGSVETIELSNIKFQDLRGAEARCQESHEPFQDGDKVVVVSVATVVDNAIDLGDVVYFVKASKAEDFFIRFLANLNPPSQEVVNNP